jgi:flagellar basal-body rod modification protein FlgD
MAIDANALNAAAQTVSNATSISSRMANSRATMADSTETFLALMTTQLKNQDPLAPMDSTQFTQQIVQMTGVEQQLLTNDLLQKLVSNTAGGLDTALGLIGKQVRAVTTDAALTNGKAEWVYKLDSDAADVKVEVLDARGQVVSATALADVKAGDHDFTWNGKNALGQTLPDGTHTLRVSAKSATGETVTGSIFIEGVVSGVEQVDGQTMLTINGSKALWSTVNSVQLPPTEASNTNTTDSQTPSEQAA